MRRHLVLFCTAVRYDLAEHARNRFAIVLVIFYVPAWIALTHAAMPDKAVPFELKATGELLSTTGNELTGLNGAINAVTLITGFMMFAATFTGGRFDRRLVMAGYPRLHLLLAKTTSLALASALVAAYATTVICLSWSPRQPLLLASALFCAALTYGALGVIFGSLLRREVEGMFAIVMTSVVDNALQNPILSSGANSWAMRFLPSYGALQAGAAAGFSDTSVPGYLGIELLWFGATALLALLAFHHRTRNRLSRTARRSSGYGPGQSAATRKRSDRQQGQWAAARLRHPLRFRLYRKAGITDWTTVAGYEMCRRLVHASGPLETAIPQLLPARLRPMLWAVYGYGRTIDDLADARNEERHRRTARVRAFSESLEAELRSGHSSDRLRAAVVHAVWTWDLPTEKVSATNALYRLEARGDHRFATWEDWHRYWDTLAFPFGIQRLMALLTPPGLAVTPSDTQALRYWNYAYSLLDCLRDLSEDAEDGRLKLPETVLDRHAVTCQELRRGQAGDRFTAMVRELTQQGRLWLDQAGRIGAEHPPLAEAFQTLIALQRLELRRMETDPQALLHRRQTVNTLRFRGRLLYGRLRVARAWQRHTTGSGAAAASALPCQRPEPKTEAPRDERRLLPPVPHPSGVRPPPLPGPLPRHVAVIMDGNGRWATDRNLPRGDGHQAGQQALRDVIYGALEIGLANLSLYVLSTENWSRPAPEIEKILRIVRDGLDLDTEEVWQRDVRLLWSGRPDNLPPELLDTLRRTVRATRTRTGLSVNLCFNYGGRNEITDAAQALARQAARGELDPDHITHRHFARHLHQPDLPDVDLLIRTGGEQRTSNFLPWQTTYAELLFLAPLWPDFDRTHLWQAIDSYGRRDRRFGATRPPATETLATETVQRTDLPRSS
ncbi:polyprenyl diphosphate synthase [Streptomyces sp. NPDC048349]|uniref:polyprenyl diphosphate synthase n=1 Tax=Streptomyces sp. NPDC048349 TaxID=3155486 RepID=UPI0034286D60